MAYNDKLQVIQQVEKALDDISFGSVELFLQDGEVTQITVKSIQKTGVKFSANEQTNNNTSSNFGLKNSTSVRHNKAHIHVKIGA